MTGIGSRTGTSSTGATGAPMSASESACSSTIETVGMLRIGSPNSTGSPNPASAPAVAYSALVSSGRGVRKRSNAASPVTQIVSAPSSLAIGATESISTRPDWNRSSSAYSRSINEGEPRGSRSRVTSGRSVKPGSGGSTVYPHV